LGCSFDATITTTIIINGECCITLDNKEINQPGKLVD
jgi:hypothetical protein